MKKYFSLAGLGLLVLLLQACGGGGGAASQPGDPQSSSCTAESQRDSLIAWMDDRYYWYSGLNGADLAASDMPAFFSSMLYKPVDRYSFAQSTASFEQTFNSGWRVGYGYTLIWEDSAHSALRVRNVEPASPVDVAGMRRGDVVVSIDGLSPTEIMAGALPAVTMGSVPRTFVLRDLAGNQREFTVTSGVYTVMPLSVTTTLDSTRNGQPVKVGYMAYHLFAQYSTWNFALATGNLAAQGIDELVLDLRYNGGGSVVTSRDLASMISGSQTEGGIYTRLKYNDKHPELDATLPFMTAEERFTQPIEGLKRLVVITSGGTASASELLINGLKPFMQVVLIGDTTYGKPYGFAPRSECGMTYNAVNFEAVNGQGEGGYSNGMPVQCTAPDDLDHQLGDAQERRLKEALNYIATGRCTAQAPQAASLVKKAPPRTFGETVPEQMFYAR